MRMRMECRKLLVKAKSEFNNADKAKSTIENRRLKSKLHRLEQRITKLEMRLHEEVTDIDISLIDDTMNSGLSLLRREGNVIYFPDKTKAS